jgi:Asp/Glu/hydantoin racemase
MKLDDAIKQLEQVKRNLKIYTIKNTPELILEKTRTIDAIDTVIAEIRKGEEDG